MQDFLENVNASLQVAFTAINTANPQFTYIILSTIFMLSEGVH